MGGPGAFADGQERFLRSTRGRSLGRGTRAEGGLSQAGDEASSRPQPDDAEAERGFKEVNEAYDALRNDDKRAAYDRYGHAAFEGTAAQGAGGFDFSGGFADIFDEMFGDFSGGRGRRQANVHGADLRYNLDVTLEDAFAGKQTRARVNTSVACDTCHGSGAESGGGSGRLPSCHGAGKIRAQQGFFTVERSCPTCQGAGRVIDNPCRACAGAGRVEREKTLSVNIPSGVEDGTRIRVSGEGEAGMRGGPSGDLYIFVSIKPTDSLAAKVLIFTVACQFP